jgi:hypothetical protein
VARNAEGTAEGIELSDNRSLAGKSVDNGLQDEHAGGDQRQPSAQSRSSSRHRPFSIRAQHSMQQIDEPVGTILVPDQQTPGRRDKRSYSRISWPHSPQRLPFTTGALATAIKPASQ